MSFVVTLHPLAEADTAEVVDYIAEQSVDGAVSWADALEEALTRLKCNADSYGQAPESSVLGRNLQ